MLSDLRSLQLETWNALQIDLLSQHKLQLEMRNDLQIDLLSQHKFWSDWELDVH